MSNKKIKLCLGFLFIFGNLINKMVDEEMVDCDDVRCFVGNNIFEIL